MLQLLENTTHWLNRLTCDGTAKVANELDEGDNAWPIVCPDSMNSLRPPSLNKAGMRCKWAGIAVVERKPANRAENHDEAQQNLRNTAFP